MKNLITIGLPSKGRLREGAIQFFEKNNFKLTQMVEIEIILQNLKIIQI